MNYYIIITWTIGSRSAAIHNALIMKTCNNIDVHVVYTDIKTEIIWINYLTKNI